MTVDATQFLPAGAGIGQLAGLRPTANMADFGVWLDSQLRDLNGLIQSNELQVRKLAGGEIDNLHQVMLDLEKARVSFQLAVQVRNKALEAYQEMMRMQI